MPDDPPNTDDDNETTENLEQRNLERSSNTAGEQPDMIDGMLDKGESETPVGPYPEPDDSAEYDLDTAKIRDFFEKKGAVEILAQLADGPKRFGEIDDALVVSHGTISTRLTEGAKLRLWHEYISYPDDGGKINLYKLNPDAQHFAVIAEDENISQTTEQLRQANEQHAAAISNFQDRLQSEKS